MEAEVEVEVEVERDHHLGSENHPGTSLFPLICPLRFLQEQRQQVKLSSTVGAGVHITMVTYTTTTLPTTPHLWISQLCPFRGLQLP